MCRFLLARSESLFDITPLLEKFATMAKNSKAFDGDWQGDGWGLSWLDEKNSWQVLRSVNPVWEDKEIYPRVKTKTVVIHVRSASFPQHKNNIEFNQPYISGKYAFVFNGLLKGVSLPYQVDGKIGAQKIWTLLQKFLETDSAETALQKTVELLQKHTKTIQALNIGLTDGEKIYAYCQYDKYPEYYNLHQGVAEDITLVCSEPLAGISFQPLHPDKKTVI